MIIGRSEKWELYAPFVMYICDYLIEFFLSRRSTLIFSRRFTQIFCDSFYAYPQETILHNILPPTPNILVKQLPS